MKSSSSTVALAVLLLVLSAVSLPSAETVREKELKRMVLDNHNDRLELRKKQEFVTDRSEKMLVNPSKKPLTGEYTVAKIPPTVKMRIIPDMVPEYLTDLVNQQDTYMTAWANWARVSRSEDNRFFFAVSDHRGYGAHLNIYEYCPARNDLVQKVVDFGKVVGWTEQSYTDGKIHGHMKIMPDGTLWAASHWGAYPDSARWANGWRGSWLISYNIYSHETNDYGIPFPGQNLPFFNIDTQRGRLVCISETTKMFFCWDCIEKKVRYAGFLPHGWIWWDRALLLDETTGKFWSVETSDDKNRLISFDPELNKFERYETTCPGLRGYAETRAADGWFYCCSGSLDFWRFRPEGPRGPEVEPLGHTWENTHDTRQMATSPKGRYIYYLPHWVPKSEGSPLVQYDTRTGKKKALCWLTEYYFEKYGYWAFGSFGLEISKDGSFIVIVMNGTFQGRDTMFGHPSLFVVGIPPEEREE